MMKNFVAHSVLVVAILFSIMTAKADVPHWKIVENHSTVTFTATQNNAPITGSFKSFTGDIQFSPEQLDKSKVRIEIDMNSLSTADKDIVNTLKTADWFNVKVFPKAVFMADKFTKTADGKYQANGNLTIRDKTLPVTLGFTLKESAPNQMTAEGSTIIKRNSFGVGQGDWSSTKEIKDDVKVEFILEAIISKL